MSKNFLISLAIHTCVLGVVLTSVSFTDKKPPITVNLSTNPAPKTVKATLVDKRVRDKALAEQAQLEALQKQKEQESIKASELKEQQLKREAELAKQKIQEETARQEKLVAEEKARKIALEKQQKQAKEQELQKQAKILQEKKDKEIKAQAKALQEKQAQAKILQEKKDKDAKALLAKQAQAAAIAAERDLIAQEHQEFLASELDKYRSTFQALVEDNRILSGVFPGKISCKIRIKLLPDGSIANVSIIESSGNQAYDDMSKTAIYKSAPFPMPEDQELYGQLRDIILSFKNEEDTLDVS